MAAGQAREPRARRVPDLKLHRTAAFFRLYGALPHRLLGHAAAFAMTRRHPAWLVQATIRAWIRRGQIDMADFEPGPFDTVERFFLRQLAPGARPLGEGFVSPVDGVVVSSGRIESDTVLVVKGHPMSLTRLLGGEAIDDLIGGHHLTIFLTPDGYHRIHLPVTGSISAERRIDGRAFPQNGDALRHLERVYERNVRVALQVEVEGSAAPLRMVLIGASLIAGIHVTAPLKTPLARGAEVGHFSFGSTVAVLAPPGALRDLAVTPGQAVAQGESLGAGRRRG